MAKQKRKKPKMSAGEAVKILANETKSIKQELFNGHQMSRDFFSLFELYVEWKGDGDEFLKHVKKTVKDRQDSQKQSVKDIIDGQKTDEQVNERDTDGDKQNERVGTEGVRSQEG